MAPIVGYFGGKFMPMHKGHLHCLDAAAKECDIVYLVLFIGGPQERQINARMNEEWLSIESRRNQIIKAASFYKNVVPVVVDVSSTVDENGIEDWEAQTPLVREKILLPITYIYGSEPGYSDYYKRNFPEAKIRLVDPARLDIPISATAIRNMTAAERKMWMV